MLLIMKMEDERRMNRSVPLETYHAAFLTAIKLVVNARINPGEDMAFIDNVKRTSR